MTAYRVDRKENITTRNRSLTTDLFRVEGMTWCVRYRIGGMQLSMETTDGDLWRLCAWLADRADNATLIVTPLP